MLLTRAPVAARSIATAALPLDLHVLSLPLAFILSQDQTLRCLFFFFFFFFFSFQAGASDFSATVLAGRISFSVVLFSLSRCFRFYWLYSFFRFRASSSFHLVPFVTGTSFNNVPCASALIVSSKLYLPQHVNDLLPLYGPPPSDSFSAVTRFDISLRRLWALFTTQPLLLPKATAKLLRLFFLHKYFCNFFYYFLSYNC